MKRILIATNALLLGIIIFQACQNNNGNPADSNVINNNITAADSCFARCASESETQWIGKIDMATAEKMHLRYLEDMGKNKIWNGDSRSDLNDTRCVWFPLATLKRFILSVESNACRNGCGDSLGVRIYYAKYPDERDAFWSSGEMRDNIKYANHHTLFMLPTYYSGNEGVHNDFNPFLAGCPKLGTVLPPGSTSILPGGILLAGDAQNHGSLIPPRTDPGTAF